MPAQRTTRTSTATSRKTADTIADARKKLAEAHEQGRHRKVVPNCPTCEQAEKAKNGGGNGKTANNKGTSSRQPRGIVFPPFREVTVLSETYLEVQGQDGETFDLVSCPRCACLIPSTGKATDPAEKAHKAFHAQLDAIIDQLSS